MIKLNYIIIIIILYSYIKYTYFIDKTDWRTYQSLILYIVRFIRKSARITCYNLYYNAVGKKPMVQ